MRPLRAGAVLWQGIRSLCHRSRRGRRGIPWGPCPDSAWRVDREPKADPPEQGGTCVTSLGAAPTPTPTPTIQVVDCSWSQALPSRGGASPALAVFRGSCLRSGVLRPLLCGQEGIPRVGGRPGRMETGALRPAGAGVAGVGYCLFSLLGRPGR